MRRILTVLNYRHLISTKFLLFYILISLYLYNNMYICMFVSALSDTTSNSERSANGGNKQILLLLLYK